ncbi:hypothetical protein [Methanogenium cariaci]|jgi:hypothetical protein
MKCFKLFLVLFIGMVIVLSAGCTASSDSESPELTPTPESTTSGSYQDQEFLSLLTESSDEITKLLDNVTKSTDNSDTDGLMIYSAGIMLISDNYKAELEALTVSPELEPSKNNYIKALEECSDAGYNYGTGAEYMGKEDYDTAEEYINKGNVNAESAIEYINNVSESLS